MESTALGRIYWADIIRNPCHGAVFTGRILYGIHVIGPYLLGGIILGNPKRGAVFTAQGLPQVKKRHFLEINTFQWNSSVPPFC
jgi:hypothetical protein